jgi:peptidoglycan-associated lipoprotein
MKHREQFIVCIVSMLLLGLSSACRKKAPVAAPPPPPEAVAPAAAKPNAPTVSEFIAEPSPIERGQSATLRWQVRDATQVQIDQGIGSVSAVDKRSISPHASTTYTLTASGPGGTATAAATLNVNSPPPLVETKLPSPPSLSERLGREVQDAYFDYDRYLLRPDAIAALTNNAVSLKTIFNDFPDTTIVLEGHCDERGSAEYNLGLGASRVSSAKEFLERLGVPGERMIAISYGKERPQCTDENEPCWQKNRRVHFAPGETPKKVITQLEESARERNP